MQTSTVHAPTASRLQGPQDCSWGQVTCSPPSVWSTEAESVQGVVIFTSCCWGGRQWSLVSCSLSLSGLSKTALGAETSSVAPAEA